MPSSKLVHMNRNKTNYGVARKTEIETIEIPIDVEPKTDEDQVVDVFCPGCETDIKVLVNRTGDGNNMDQSVIISGVVFLVSLLLRLFVFTSGILSIIMIILTIGSAMYAIGVMLDGEDPYFVLEAPEDSDHGIQIVYQEN